MESIKFFTVRLRTKSVFYDEFVVLFDKKKRCYKIASYNTAFGNFLCALLL